MILNDREIRLLCRPELNGEAMITPFVDWGECPPGVVSFGLSHAGYDIRLGTKFQVLKNTHCEVLDPRLCREENYRKRMFDEIEACMGHIDIPGNGYILGHSVECFCIPDNILGKCLGKSTYARCGLIVNVTPLEPGWRGHLTIEISNSGPAPARVYTEQGIAQILFHRLVCPPEVTYAQKQGVYQDQGPLTLARVRE